MRLFLALALCLAFAGSASADVLLQFGRPRLFTPRRAVVVVEAPVYAPRVIAAPVYAPRVYAPVFAAPPPCDVPAFGTYSTFRSFSTYQPAVSVDVFGNVFVR
ncbi:MAG TPA: hypothetical protein VD932_02580 [Aquabacterium sp.]|nr:hypothetical protein [Aquabacterium sp.]